LLTAFFFLKKENMLKKILLIQLIIITTAISCSSPTTEENTQAKHAKGSLFIIGGGSRPDALVNRMIDESGLRNGGYAVVLPMSSSMPDSAIIWSSEQFIENGISNIYGFNFLPDTEIEQQWIDSIKNASLIYISGGDQNRFMAVAGGTEIEFALKEAWQGGAMIAGTSAGAAVMSKNMITGDELRKTEYSSTFSSIESENLELAPGLGFLENAIIDQHFIKRSRHNRLLSAIIENPEIMGIGIDESTAILVRNNEAEVIGTSQVMVFRNPGQSYFELDNKLGARDLTIDLYLPGEKFAIK
jgi:cyanophycinase